MGDESGESSGEDRLAKVMAEAQRLLEEIKQLRTQAEEQLKAAALARKGADSEALYAHQAKGYTEEHSTAIANFKGKAEADVNSIAANKKNFDELVATVTVGKAAVESDIKMIEVSRKAVEQSSSQILQSAEESAPLLQQIQESKTSAVAASKEAIELRDAAIQARNKTETAQTEAEQLSENAKQLIASITVDQQKSTDASAQIITLLTGAKDDQESLREVLEHLSKSHEIASGFEGRVTKSSKDLEELIKKVDGLLPGATSASLASAFGKQKTRFTIPKVAWVIVFVVCIGGLVAVSYPSFRLAISAKPSGMKWDDILVGLVMRLPIVIPLVWLGIYSGRNYMLSLRLEEDYAYKEAISTAFEGYRRELEKIAAGDALNPTPLTTLCINILRAIAERPGRIYEGKQQDMTIFAELKAAADKADELRKKTVATQ
jgi:hypothetical protein